jgi:hypothetical protein
MVVLAGLDHSEAVTWVRAVETADQQKWEAWFSRRAEERDTKSG